MTHIHHRIALALFTTLFLIGWFSAPIGVTYAATEAPIYIQIELTDEEADLYEEASLVYGDETYYGTKWGRAVWLFLLPSPVTDGVIDTVSLYDESGVPYTYTPFAVTSEDPMLTTPEEEVSEEAAPSEGTDPVEESPIEENPNEVVDPPEPVTPEPDIEEQVTEEETTPTLEEEAIPLQSEVNVGNEAAVESAVIGGDIGYTFYVENTGETTLFLTSARTTFFEGDLDAATRESFDEALHDTFMERVGEDGLKPGERIEVSQTLSIPTTYDQEAEPEIGSVFEVIVEDEFGQTLRATSQQIVLLETLSFTMDVHATPSTIHPGETIRYTFTFSNPTNLTLRLQDATLQWTDGALPRADQLAVTTRFLDELQALLSLQDGLNPEETVTYTFEQQIASTYDVRSGATLHVIATVAFGVSPTASVARATETTTHVEQVIVAQEPTKTVTEPVTTATTEQAVLPMTGTRDSIWTIVIGLFVIAIGLSFFFRNQRTRP